MEGRRKQVKYSTVRKGGRDGSKERGSGGERKMWREEEVEVWKEKWRKRGGRKGWR